MHCNPQMLTATTVTARFNEFQASNFQLCNKSLKDWSLGKQLILFPLNLNVSFGSALGNLEILRKQN